MNTIELQELNRAVVLAHEGRQPEAQNILGQLRRMYPDDPDVLVWLAYTAPELKAARAAIEDARRFNPSHPAVIQAQEWLRQKESQVYHAPPVSAPPVSSSFNANSSYPANPPMYNPGLVYPAQPVRPGPPPARPRDALSGFTELQRQVYNRQRRQHKGRLRRGGGCSAVFLVLIGLVLGSAAFYFYQTNQSYLTKGTVATAIVTKNRLSTGKNPSYYPTFRFQTKTGETIEVESGFGSSPASYSVGQHVQVYYKPENPRDFRVDDFENIWLLPAILGSIGGFMLLIGLATLIRRPGRSYRRSYGESYDSDGGDWGNDSGDWNDSGSTGDWGGDSGSSGDWGGGDSGDSGGGGGD